MNDASSKHVCVLAPCFNEAGSIEKFVSRVKAVATQFPAFDFEILLIDDGSRDGTDAIIARLAMGDPAIRGVILSRNFGHQRAIVAGLDVCDADYVVVIDADLQDPPELIPQMLDRLEEGYDVVHAVRADRSVDSFIKRTTARGFYAFMRRWALPELVENAADFKAFNRRAFDALMKYREHVRFLRGLVATLGFRQTTVSFTRAARYSGFSKYRARNVLRLARDAIVSNTVLPLRAGLYLGLLLWCALPVYAAVCLWMHFQGAGLGALGLHLLAGLFMSLFGAVFILIGVIGEYLKIIMLEVKDRPLYIVRESFNLPVRR